ncbi:MAG: DsbA family protein [Caulobacter sp.]|nr:DsbA family protein [Caulobacter sp.]
MRTSVRLVIGLIALVLLPAVSMAARPAPRPDDMTLGNPKAKVVVVEYASLSCPHCARFHADVFPAFRKTYIDSGKVQFIYREFVTRPAEIAVPGTMLARCAGKDRYFQVIERAFAVQAEIYEDGTVGGVHRILRREAAALGMDGAQYDACLRDEAAFEALKARLDRAETEDKVTGTPTFEVNGKRIAPPLGKEMDLATLDAAIRAAARGK